MADFQAPLRNIRFTLFDVFGADQQWANTPALAGVVDRETAEAMLEGAAKITEQEIAPINRSGDEEGATWDNGKVTTPAGFKEAYDAYCEGGWPGITGNADFGGFGMPKALGAQVDEMLYASNSSFALYPNLSAGASLAIEAHASEALKALYLPRMYAGEWAGSMCLTESHAGSDLGIIRTKAEPSTDGTHKISGTKIFITGGDQDLTANIVHLVLARLPGAPKGPKGISLFIVPKINVDSAGELLEANRVSCGSIEHKMGIKGSATCVINFDDATGYLVGEPNRGLSYMFTMMNYERLSIGVQGLGCGDRSMQSAIAYAKDRRQGRAATGAVEPEAFADTLLVHADVRRMLLTMKSLTEAGRALSTYVAMELDKAKYAESTADKVNASAMVALLTPIAKAFLTDMGLDVTVMGQQVFGGHGYIREWGQEQLVRDVRIAQIYEGTNGIQAHDLLGRKVVFDRGEAFGLLKTEIDEFISQASSDLLAPYCEQLSAALMELSNLTDELIQKVDTNPHEMGAAAVEYLHIFGYVLYGYMWLRMASVAEEKLAGDDGFYQSKLDTMTFFFARVLPRVSSLIISAKSGCENTEINSDWL
ncbi:acyl-CoA dehydrogenase [Gammaproteobacteria bacterium 45_16_T64]|nr:acyl-CoA dehydrogenase [Gammaproteobacteria bacterium 45_16_T64]